MKSYELHFSFIHRAQISAPLDLLSESLASSSSLISQLMKRNEERGPVASALAAKQSRRLANPKFKRRRTTTPSPIDRIDSFSTREPLVFACNDPEGCPTPVSGVKYNPNEFGGPSTEKDVLKVFFLNLHFTIREIISYITEHSSYDLDLR